MVTIIAAIMLTECLLYTKHYFKYFTFIRSFTPYSNFMM